MGCFQSRDEPSDLHPNVFRVVNIDDNGSDLCSGQLEITESEIILYREGRDCTVWPLHSLRRYGFEADIFSFESGRRCETGEGIYAFRCRRAPILFRQLQRHIQLRNVIHESVPYPSARISPSFQSRAVFQANAVHRSSVDNGQPDTLRPIINNNLSSVIENSVMPGTIDESLISPSSVEVTDDVMPLYSQDQDNSNHGNNFHQLRGYKREHNNNHDESATGAQHVYSNDLSRDLAILRNTLRQETAINTMRDIEDETRFLESRFVNENVFGQTKSPMSPTLSSSSEHYAQLSLEQQKSARLYMNIVPENNPTEVNSNEINPITPPTPKQLEYCNIMVGNKPDFNSYANLSLGELGDSVRNMKQALSFSAPVEHNQKHSESDTFTSMSPVEELEVNYAVLDIESSKEFGRISRDLTSPESHSFNSSKNESVPSCSSQSRVRLVSQCSIDKIPTANNTVPTTSIGYTTIDFDKTVALTSVAAGADDGSEGPRKTRHNSCSVVFGSPGSADKNKSLL